MDQPRLSTMQQRLQVLAHRMASPADVGDSSETQSESDLSDFVTEFNHFRRLPPPSNSQRRQPYPTQKQNKTFTREFILVDPGTTKINVNRRRGSSGQSQGPTNKKKLTIPMDSDADDFREHLEVAFPQLQGRDFELCICRKASLKRTLEPIPPHANNPKAIKEWKGLNRSRIYIRPDHNQVVDAGITVVVMEQAPRDLGDIASASMQVVDAGEAALPTGQRDLEDVPTTSAQVDHPPRIPLDSGTPTVSFRDQRLGDHDLPAVQLQASHEPLRQAPKQYADLELQRAFFALHTSMEGSQNITVRRDAIVEDVLRVYAATGVVFSKLEVTFDGEDGLDLGGITKDLLTTFWRKAVQLYFKGEAAVVPCLPLHLMRKKLQDFTALGRVLTHTAALCQFLPGRLSRSFYLTLVYGCEGVSDNVAIEDFLLYNSERDRQLITRAREEFISLTGGELEDLTMLFSMYGMLEFPTGREFENQLLTMARNEMVDKPLKFISMMKRGIPEEHTNLFWCLLTTEGIDHVFMSQRPTVSSVISVMKTDEVLTPEQDIAVYLLKSYIHTLDQEDLEAFLLFVTGSTILPEAINRFNRLTGLLRRPIAHTCTNTLELPTTYVSIQDLKREFRAVLSNSASFQMDSL